MKIVYCYLTADTDGSTIHIDSFMQAFTALGGEVIDAGLRTKPFTGNKSEWSLAKKIWARLLWIRLNFVICLKVYRLAVRSKVDLLLFRFMPNHQLFLPILLLSFFYPVVLELNDVRAIESPSQANWLTDLLDRVTLWRIKRCFVVSKILKSFIINRTGIDKSKIAVIENGVDVEAFDNRQASTLTKQPLCLENAFVVGFVGSFKPWHGLENLIPLAEALRVEGVNIRFLIVGDGKERAVYEEMLRTKGISSFFCFAGFVPHEQVRDYLALMDVAIAPYKSGSFKETGCFYFSPLKIFEYMAMGKAIITAPLGQIQELIVDGESGRLIYAEDTAALKEAVLRMYHDLEYRTSLGLNARKRVQKYYSWRANAEKVRALCLEAMG
jgi:glycosyltransferase involved in cell wall biosynthesis